MLGIWGFVFSFVICLGIWRFVHDLFGDSGILGFRFFFSDLFRDLWILVLGVFFVFCFGISFSRDLFGNFGIFVFVHDLFWAFEDLVLFTIRLGILGFGDLFAI